MSNYISPAPGYRVWRIKGWHGSFHLLHDMELGEATLIDTGLVGEIPQVEAILRDADLGWSDIKAILLTHGHLDHTGNLARLKKLTGAAVLAHPLEQAHIDGVFPYTGLSHVCGWLEAVGRRLFNYRSVPIDQPLASNDELPFWGGLRVMHLPGHTAGHCGFYSERFNILFSGDLFASYWISIHLPPAILNSCPEKMEASLRRVRELSPNFIIPNHYSRLDGELHRRSFNKLVSRLKA